MFKILEVEKEEGKCMVKKASKFKETLAENSKNRFLY